ncbi:MAG TPA: sugar kinase [Candidatus Brocadiia bacterium]|nr:sugar kinase [Candidatus Brocadiia bacterium]
MARVVTFGEIMLRLSPPGFLRFTQATSFDAIYGGGEANVAVSLAQFGVDVAYVTALPKNEIGDACRNSLRQFGVDTRHIIRQGDRLGIYFCENGAVQRASKVIYDRAGASIATAKPGDFKWDAAFAGAEWFHITGITPAISQCAADSAIESCRKAKAAGLKVSVDLNYRKNLWKYGKTAGEVMPELVKHADVAIGNEEDADKVFGIKAPHADVEGGKVNAEDYRFVCEKLVEKFPSLSHVAITLRGSISASHNTWSGVFFEKASGKMFTGPNYDITHIVDRVGGGDSFAAGIIYQLLHGKPGQETIDFAVAASCLKHTILGDANMVSVAEVEALIKGGGSGRVQR